LNHPRKPPINAWARPRCRRGGSVRVAGMMLLWISSGGFKIVGSDDLVELAGDVIA
jgi:hypothetical protein